MRPKAKKVESRGNGKTMKITRQVEVACPLPPNFILVKGSYEKIDVTDLTEKEIEEICKEYVIRFRQHVADRRMGRKATP